ncbi:hypothetical protein TTHERM_000586566 (macronuclear) [Tetrahymena thermophila SB210]|uniref:Uncharacterized protein n=1 Tax=Tetrahymena thermophila (strain SB210) TaxID=312017 RepID=W7XIM7_TETTS|nr:hypothetical protein TTHERM_000586566 [Tetrahymena thermophila SB210]EWS73434.1 hypothetical protein TTHERM_000586566 [Tetrahymena thermophila SB210]|eukprot:XP_012654005.1 hypothetical protein TTHERM_000586566 [Tetrahymena thermophila SB210]
MLLIATNYSFRYVVEESQAHLMIHLLRVRFHRQIILVRAKTLLQAQNNKINPIYQEIQMMIKKNTKQIQMPQRILLNLFSIF